ncbi:MAG: YifB family Mg chelatase-like AAA ATPase [Pseudomonadota bacterium]
MSTALIMSRGESGLDAPPVRVEVHLPSGLPGFGLSGLNAPAARDRVKSAIENSGFDYPNCRVSVNLGPAELRKQGCRYDLAIAAGILVASAQLPAELFERWDLLGELSLLGDVRGIRGVLSAARAAASEDRALLAPAGNRDELAAQQQREDAAPAATGGLPISAPERRLIRHLSDLRRLPGLPRLRAAAPVAKQPEAHPLRAVIGQQVPKRALCIAAAGGHHLLMEGPPGAGKTMLAERLQRLLPPPAPDQLALGAEIHSLCGLPPPDGSPFRAPHHSASAAALAGGGNPPTPGEVSLAHAGVLFLDELPEFRRDALETLREPLEAGTVRLSRSGASATYPASFQLVAAMNPCPAGLVCRPADCRCTPDQARRYRQRISAPLLDRIDLHLSVEAVPLEDLLAGTAPATAPDESRAGRPEAERPDVSAHTDAKHPDSALPEVEDIAAARAAAVALRGVPNAALRSDRASAALAVDGPGARLLERAVARLRFSARGYFRVLRVARTIMDLSGAPEQAIDAKAIAEALSYRPRG